MLIADAILFYRKKKGLTQRELAERSGVSLSSIRSWERHSRIPRDVYQIKKVADTLGVTIDALLTYSDKGE